MDPGAYSERIERQRRRSRHRIRWVSALVSKARLNPGYAIERIRKWLVDPSLTLVKTDALFSIEARDADGNVAFAAEEFPETICERWNGEDMVEFWGDPWPFSDADWPLGPGACSIPEGATATIFDKVFDFLSVRDISVCARVNRAWRSCAMHCSKVATIVPLRHRDYRVHIKYRGKVTRTIRMSDLRMATLFAPWESWTPSVVPRFDLVGVPNSLELLNDVLLAWFRARAPRTLASAEIFPPGRIVRRRPTVGLLVWVGEDCACEFLIYARDARQDYVHLGINGFSINGRRCDLPQFVARISDAQLEWKK